MVGKQVCAEYLYVIGSAIVSNINKVLTDLLPNQLYALASDEMSKVGAGLLV